MNAFHFNGYFLKCESLTVYMFFFFQISSPILISYDLYSRDTESFVQHHLFWEKNSYT